MSESGPDRIRAPSGRREALLLLPAVIVVFALVALIWGLRARHASPPEPPRETFVRQPLFLDLTETLDGKPSDGRFLRSQVAGMCCLYGYPVVEDAGAAPWTLRVRAATASAGTVSISGTPIEWKFKTTVSVEVLGQASAEPLEAFEVPDIQRGASEPARALRFTRLQTANIVGKRAFQEGQVLGNPDVFALLLELQYTPRKGRYFNEIYKEIVDIGLRAVPDLILAMEDTRTVALPGDFGGVTDENRKAFLMCHFADWCLETILEIESPLALSSDREHRARVKEAWYRAWTRRCGAYPCPAAQAAQD
ncbi:MAG: hypothetical protein JXP34_13210 [Planctomycetes bacterium]|nr:hypothetical protein [Planctomycetota bacterium]